MLAVLLCGSWVFGVWWFSRGWSDGGRATLILGSAACIAVGLGSPGIWLGIRMGYPGDSFWTLGPGGRAGVVAISLLGFSAIFALLAAKTRRIIAYKAVPPPILFVMDLGAGLLMYGLIYSASPQVFYTFYRVIFPGLPNQIVVASLFDLPRLQTVAALAPGGTLSDHLAGVGLWAVVPFTLWLHLNGPDRPFRKIASL